jgi:hypothetical protein
MPRQIASIPLNPLNIFEKTFCSVSIFKKEDINFSPEYHKTISPTEPGTTKTGTTEPGTTFSECDIARKATKPGTT